MKAKKKNRKSSWVELEWEKPRGSDSVGLTALLKKVSSVFRQRESHRETSTNIFCTRESNINLLRNEHCWWWCECVVCLKPFSLRQNIKDRGTSTFQFRKNGCAYARHVLWYLCSVAALLSLPQKRKVAGVVEFLIFFVEKFTHLVCTFVILLLHQRQWQYNTGNWPNWATEKQSTSTLTALTFWTSSD